MMIERLLVGALALGLAGCGHPLASVKNTTARYEASASAGPPRSPLPERKIVAAQKLQQRDPLEAIGEYLSAAEAAANRLREQPKDAAALRDYNFALARVFSAVRAGQIDAWSQPLSVPGYVVTHRKDTRALWNPADYEFTPCDELVVGGTAFDERARRVGLGAPVLATRRTAVKDYKEVILSHGAHLLWRHGGRDVSGKSLRNFARRSAGQDRSQRRRKKLPPGRRLQHRRRHFFGA